MAYGDESGAGGGGGGSNFTAASATAVTVGTSSRPYGSDGQVTIVYTGTAPVITSPRPGSALLAGTAGLPYSATITATGIPAPAFTATGLPAGLSINSATGVISGTPVTAGTYPAVAVTATSPAGTATATYRLTVRTPPYRANLSVKITGPATAASRAKISYTVTVTNGGPATATRVETSVATRGLTAVSASTPGSHHGIGVTTLLLTEPSLAAGATVSYTITGTVTAPRHAIIGVVAATRSRVPDPELRNNVSAITEKVT